MASAGWALQRAVHQALTADAGLLTLLGGARVWDHVPRGAAFPYVSIGATTERDWSTDGSKGLEHVLILNVWSKAAGRHEANAIADALRAALHDAQLTLAGHRLVNLRHELTEVGRDAAAEIYRGAVRFRAVTEDG